MARLSDPASSTPGKVNTVPTTLNSSKAPRFDANPVIPAPLQYGGDKQALSPKRNTNVNTGPTSRAPSAEVTNAVVIQARPSMRPSVSKSLPASEGRSTALQGWRPPSATTISVSSPAKPSSKLFTHFSAIVASLDHHNHSRTFMTIEHRQKSLDHSHVAWPHEKPSIHTMVEAGFVFLPHHNGLDHVVCFACGLNVSNWDGLQDPFEVHWELSPDCSWLRWKPDNILKACYSCKLCTATFPREVDLVDHLSYHNTTKKMYDAATSSGAKVVSAKGTSSLSSSAFWTLPATPDPPKPKPSFLSIGYSSIGKQSVQDMSLAKALSSLGFASNQSSNTITQPKTPRKSNQSPSKEPASPSSCTGSELFITPPTSPK